MVNVILSHEVKDFSVWKKGFDEGAPLRTKSGVKTTGVFTAVDNSNQVTIITEFPSVEAVRGFLDDPELKASMEKAGVVGKPDIKILKKV